MKKLHNIGDDLYIISAGDYLKIGRTSNVEERLRYLQVYNPEDLTIIRRVPGAGYREKEIHETCAFWYKRGEWFHKDCLTTALSLID